MWTVVLVIVAPAVVLSVPILVLVTEIIAAAATRPETASSVKTWSLRIAVIVPAHNESAGLLPTLSDLQAQIRPGDRIVVVADNCSDDTAEIAATKDVEVVIRHDANLIGKGYALAAGLAHIKDDPPDLVLFCDADCRIASGLLDRLAEASSASGRPSQACYLMKAPPDSPTDHTLAEFAWTLKNLIRPLGLHRFGGPCQLMGTGMMFPWRLIQSAPLASGNLVEDLQLGVDLALKGYAPLFVPQAVTISVFPSSATGAKTQRNRWIEGHLGTIIHQTPRLVGAAIRRADLNLLVLALDLAVPPLTLLVAMTVAAWLLAAVGAMAGLPIVLLFPASLNLLLLSVGLMLAWFRFRPDMSGGPALSVVATQIVSKLDIYWQLARGRRSKSWIRTQRNLSNKIHKDDIEPDHIQEHKDKRPT